MSEGQLSLEDTQGVLSDALLLLACKEIKLSPGGDGAAGTVDEADGDMPAAAAAAAATARGKLLSQVARKATVEAIVPVVVEFKRFLEGQHTSPATTIAALKCLQHSARPMPEYWAITPIRRLSTNCLIVAKRIVCVPTPFRPADTHRCCVTSSFSCASC